MSEVPKVSTVLSKREDLNSVDYLQFFTEMVLELFSQDGNFLVPFPEVESGPCQNGSGHDNSRHGPSLLFEKGMGHNISDNRRERLTGLLNESKEFIKYDINEMVDNIIAINRIETDSRKHADGGQSAKLSTRLKKTQFVSSAPDSKSSASFKKVYSNFQTLLGEGLEYKEALDMLRNEVFTKLGKLKLRLEDYLDVLTSKNRPMTAAEKQQLGQQIQQLPQGALDRVVEIIQRRLIPETHPSDRNIDVNLEKVDNATLWRLYIFVQAVAIRRMGH